MPGYMSSRSNASDSALAPLVSAHWYLTNGDIDPKIKRDTIHIHNHSTCKCRVYEAHVCVGEKS